MKQTPNSQTTTTITHPMPDAYYEQLRMAYEYARANLVAAAEEGRAAQARWHAAIEREMVASRRYRDAMLAKAGVKS